MSFAGKVPFITGVNRAIGCGTISLVGRAGAKIAAASLSLLVFSADSSAQERLERVNLAIPVTALSQLPSYAGVRFGLFREEGLDRPDEWASGRAGVVAGRFGLFHVGRHDDACSDHGTAGKSARLRRYSSGVGPERSAGDQNRRRSKRQEYRGHFDR